MQIPPPAPAELPAKLPQQPPQDQDDLEHDRPSNLSARVGQLCAWLLEAPSFAARTAAANASARFVRFLQRSRALRLQATRHQHCPIAFFGSPQITHALAFGEKRSSPLCLGSFIRVSMFQFLGCTQEKDIRRS
jgi:hypothetical protein